MLRVHKNIIIIEDPSETDIPDHRPIRDTAETDMSDQRPIGDLDMPHRPPICPIRDQYALSETELPHRRPICLFRQACRSPIRHIGLQWVSDEACRGLRSGMLVSKRSPIIIIFSWTQNVICNSVKKSQVNFFCTKSARTLLSLSHGCLLFINSNFAKNIILS